MIRILAAFAEPAALGATHGKLASCPESPNCVSSHEGSDLHACEPLPLLGSAADSLARLRNIVSGLPRTKIVTLESDYMHTEFRSLLFGFVDDVEFLVDEEQGVIHSRSASRLGYSDLGVNRARMTRIRQFYLEE